MCLRLPRGISDGYNVKRRPFLADLTFSIFSRKDLSLLKLKFRDRWIVAKNLRCFSPWKRKWSKTFQRRLDNLWTAIQAHTQIYTQEYSFKIDVVNWDTTSALIFSLSGFNLALFDFADHYCSKCACLFYAWPPMTWAGRLKQLNWSQNTLNGPLSQAAGWIEYKHIYKYVH